MRRILAPKLAFFALLALSYQAPSRAQTGDISSQISAQYRPSVVFLAVQGVTSNGQQENKTGTGFLISDQGYVLTASHLFTDSNRVSYAKVLIRGSRGASFDIQAPTGTILPLELIRMNAEIDVALTKLPTPVPPDKYTAVHFCRALGNREGDRVHSLGFPLGMPLSVNSGTLASKDGPRGLWKTDILVNEGSSGGPVFDNSGHVIGMIKGGITPAPGNNFIVPANLMLDLLQAGMSSLDECPDNAQALSALDCRSKIISHDIDLTKSDHPTFNADTRVFSKVYPAEPGYTIENVQFVAASKNNATDPDITISPDKTSVRFQSSISSGPFFDQWRGWVSGKLITTQKPKCN
jgi:S1-C subfamily serine protease